MSNFRHIDDFGDKQGACLFRDTGSGSFIRSGKASRPFQERYKEHQGKAMLETVDALENRFYSSYPTKVAAKRHNLNPQGFFEDLTCLVALGFSSDDGNDILAFYVWKKDVMTHVQDKAKKSSRAPSCIQLDLVAYLIELVYGLLLAKSDDISSNPGFETYVGVWTTPKNQ